MKPEIPLSRRQFLSLGGASVVELALVYAGFPLILEKEQELAKWALTAPDLEDQAPIPYPFPGWLESRNPKRPPLLTDSGGHEGLLTFILLNDPLFYNSSDNTGLLPQVLTDFFSQEPPVTPPLLGDTLAKYIDFAQENLGNKFPNIEPSWSNILHVAFFLFAAIHGPYFNRNMLVNTLKISLGKFWQANLIKDEKWWEMSVSLIFPRVYPVPDGQCDGTPSDINGRCQGTDRAVHFAQFAFLSHFHNYALRHNLPDAWRIPRLAHFLVSRGITYEDQTRMLMELAGLALEFQQAGEHILERLLGDGAEKFFGRRPKRNERGDIIVKGILFDPLTNQDLSADRLGTEIGLRLSSDSVDEKMVTEVIERLNSPDINSFPTQSPSNTRC